MGRQVLSVYPALPSTVFTSSKKDHSFSGSVMQVGPGEYDPPPGACEPQVDSRKRTCGSIKFGKGYRKGTGITKMNLGEPSPGNALFHNYLDFVANVCRTWCICNSWRCCHIG